MGLFGRLKEILRPERGLELDELARRLGRKVEDLRSLRPAYHVFSVPKRSGGERRIAAPLEPLRGIQRAILRRLLARLRAHPAATGFERGQSIVTNALRHEGKAVVIRMDLKDFFGATGTPRIRAFFRGLGWGGEASDLLTALTTHEGGLPQGAPTSPRLANLVNRGLDARLAGLAMKVGATYSRYADDLTFSFQGDDPVRTHTLIRAVQIIARNEGYELHMRKKLHIRRRHDRQVVTGLVVNERVNLPRKTRRWLRAVAHHQATGRPVTLTPAQFEGWRSLLAMVVKQTRV
jgi:retron-type reverse transcriptase